MTDRRRRRPDERTPHDGRPFYCVDCGAGFGEYLACEEGDCALESVATAEARAEQFKASPASSGAGAPRRPVYRGEPGAPLE